MALLHIPLEQIAHSHLQGLIDAAAAESRSIEYKRETYGPTDQTEFLNDVSSFANTSGGDIVLGMMAQQGIPTGLSPLAIDLDAEKLRLEQIARTGLQPRLPSLNLRPVAVPDGSVLIVRVPRSFASPHRVIRQGGARFWARSSSGKYEPDVAELRQLFLAAPQLAERIREFRLDRIAKILGGQPPVPLINRGILVVHIVPLLAFDMSFALPLHAIRRDMYNFAPMGSRAWQSNQINFDGIIMLSNAANEPKVQRAYVQLYRSGIIEAVDSTMIASERPLVLNLEDKLPSYISRFLNDLAAIAIAPPYAVLVSFLGVKDTRLNLDRGITSGVYDDYGAPFDRDHYHFNEVIFEAVPQNQEEAARGLRPVLDQIANAAGQVKSRSFHDDGRYIPLRT